MRLFYLIIIGAAFIFPQHSPEAVTFSPSYYFTYGQYDNKDISRSHAFYGTVNYHYTDYITLAHDNLNISNEAWVYSQRMYLGGILHVMYPHYLKVYYAHIDGDMNLNPNPLYDVTSYNYADNTNLISADFSTYYNGWFAGASGTFTKANGFLTPDSLREQTILQIVLRIEYYFNRELFFSVKPAYTNAQDGRKLISATWKVLYRPFDEFLLKASAAIGQRAYYFDTDQLTIFNQDQSQRSLYSLQAEYSLPFNTDIIAAAISTQFANYHVNYFAAGIRSRFAIF